MFSFKKIIYLTRRNLYGKIEINKDACIGCGQCVHRHPEYIAFDENGQAEPVGKEIKPEDKKEFLETIEICPTEAITIIEE